MIKDIINDEVLFTPESNKELYGLTNDLNSQYIPYKSFCGVLIVLTYSAWLNSNLSNNY